jgi:hypothetical protein
MVPLMATLHGKEQPFSWRSSERIQDAFSAVAGRGGVDGRDGSPSGQPGETRADGPDARNCAGAMHAAIGRQAAQRFSGTVRGAIQSYRAFRRARPVR